VGVVATFTAQVVITMKSVSLGRCCSVLIMAEWNRIYAVTRKNRIIASCFGVITISQLILGLYVVVVDTAWEGYGESVTSCPHDSCLPHYSSVTDSAPSSDLYGVHLRGTSVHGNWIYRHVSRIRYGASLVVHRSSRRHPP